MNSTRLLQFRQFIRDQWTLSHGYLDFCGRLNMDKHHCRSETNRHAIDLLKIAQNVEEVSVKNPKQSDSQRRPGV